MTNKVVTVTPGPLVLKPRVVTDTSRNDVAQTEDDEDDIPLQARFAPVQQPNPFVEQESFVHRFAKKVLIQWFRKSWQRHKGMRLGQFHAYNDDINGDHGVHPEYVIAKWPDSERVVGVTPLWHHEITPHRADDECKDPRCLHQLGNILQMFGNRPPTYEEATRHGFQVLCKPDVGIIERGRLKYAFEVHWKHAIPEKKIERYLQYCPGLEVHEIEAEWILRQLVDKTPDHLVTRKLCPR